MTGGRGERFLDVPGEARYQNSMKPEVGAWAVEERARIVLKEVAGQREEEDAGREDAGKGSSTMTGAGRGEVEEKSCRECFARSMGPAAGSRTKLAFRTRRRSSARSLAPISVARWART